MVINDQLDSDIRGFFEQIKGQTQEGQRGTLKNLLDKYIHLNTSEYILSHNDLHTIITNAKNIYSTIAMPITIGDSYQPRVDKQNVPNLCVIEATIGTLNQYNCLKRLPKFDYKKK